MLQCLSTIIYSLFYQPRKADFIVLYSGQIIIRLPLVFASPYLLHALAMAWEFTNTTLRFLPSI
nr:MAG TPA: Auxin response factor [Caudoviricetes sp.]